MVSELKLRLDTLLTVKTVPAAFPAAQEKVPAVLTVHAPLLEVRVKPVPDFELATDTEL